MIRLLKYTVLQFVFWILFFAVNRLVFLLYYMKTISIENIAFSEVLKTFPNAFKLDMSTACYFLIPSFILFFFQSRLKKKRFFSILNAAITYLLIIVYSFITGGEMGVYGEWKTKLSYKALSYFQHPAEVYNSTSVFSFFFLLVLVLLIIIVSIYSYNRFFYSRGLNYVKLWKHNIAYAIIAIPLMFIGIRGGFQEIPITQSESYFSKHNILNLSAVNNAYNLGLSVMETGEFLNKNPFMSMPDAEADKIVTDLYKLKKDSTYQVLNTAKPNIVMVILESWSGDLIESLGGKPGITPRFAELEKEGLLFTQHYSSGNRSQQAMASFFSGFPAIPVTTITNHPDKYHNLPSMIKQLNTDGYSTSFYFGGQLNYGNIKAYLVFNEFGKIVEGEDLPKDLPRGKLGVPDGDMFPEHIKALNKEKQPFYSAIFTLSSHSPYDQPMKPVIDWAGNENPFINSAYYSDRSLGEYMAKAKQQDWYKNTLFVIVADHSHNTYRNWPLESFVYHKVPLLLCGGALKQEYRGKQDSRIVMNTDITSSILTQLGLSSNDYPYSKNLFDYYCPEFAYFELNNGFGWKTKKGEFIYNKEIERPYLEKVDSLNRDTLLIQGKAYSQKVFKDFIDL
ncbi:MAG: LTA synthase family protein [Bacteroidales bacterium]